MKIKVEKLLKDMVVCEPTDPSKQFRLLDDPVFDSGTNCYLLKVVTDPNGYLVIPVGWSIEVVDFIGREYEFAEVMSAGQFN